MSCKLWGRLGELREALLGGSPWKGSRKPLPGLVGGPGYTGIMEKLMETLRKRYIGFSGKIYLIRK